MSCQCRDHIKTGDLLAWSDYTQDKSSFWLRLVRLGTMSEYGHVSIAWRRGDQLFQVEATMPYIRVTPVVSEDSFFYVPMAHLLEKTPNMTGFFADKIGQPYSWQDALRAFLGFGLKHDNRWQCAELANAFFLEHGVNLGDKNVTPSRVVRAALDQCGTSLTRISAVNSKQESNPNG